MLFVRFMAWSTRTEDNGFVQWVWLHGPTSGDQEPHTVPRSAGLACFPLAPDLGGSGSLRPQWPLHAAVRGGAPASRAPLVAAPRSRGTSSFCVFFSRRDGIPGQAGSRTFLAHPRNADRRQVFTATRLNLTGLFSSFFFKLDLSREIVYI